MRAYRFNFSERRGEIIEYGKCYDKCIATNWGLVFFDEHQHDRIHLMSLDGKREKILWNRNEEHFDFITFDDDKAILANNADWLLNLNYVELCW